jgi:hypothetical protein
MTVIHEFKMTGKRKRTRSKQLTDDEPRKKAKPDHCTRHHRLGCGSSTTISHPLLSLYYSRVITLRDYVVSRLPSSSKTRQRKIASLGTAARGPAIGGGVAKCESDELALATLLDSTLVGVPFDANSDTTGHLKELETFSQQHSASANSTGGAAYSQSEVGGRIS